MVMPTARPSRKLSPRTARTIRFPAELHRRLASDAERCGRSLEAQVIAILRRHYGQDVDLAPAPDVVLSLARGSLAGISEADQQELGRRLGDVLGD